jgi:hypothetical protein
MPGFILRIFAGGPAVYGVRFRVGRQQRSMPRGPVVEGGLKEVRKAAGQAINKVKLAAASPHPPATPLRNDTATAGRHRHSRGGR